MTEEHGVEHYLLGKLLRLGLDHQDRGFRPRDHQIELRAFELARGGIQHVLAADVSHPRPGDRTVEGNTGYRNRSGGADQGRDVGIDLRIEGEHRRDDLHLMPKGTGKGGTQRPVDQTAGERGLFAGTPLPLEEALRGSCPRSRSVLRNPR